MDPEGIIIAEAPGLEDFAVRAHPEDALKWTLYSGDYVRLQCLGLTFWAS